MELSYEARWGHGRTHTLKGPYHNSGPKHLNPPPKPPEGDKRKVKNGTQAEPAKDQTQQQAPVVVAEKRKRRH